MSRYDVVVGFRFFTDGTCRAVYLDADERQYVLGDHAEPIYGQWLMPGQQQPDTPVIVEAGRDGS
jgi:hypothetical protein